MRHQSAFSSCYVMITMEIETNMNYALQYLNALKLNVVLQKVH